MMEESDRRTKRSHKGIALMTIQKNKKYNTLGFGYALDCF